MIANFNKTGTPLRDWQHGTKVDSSKDVSGAPQLDKLGVDIEA